MGMTAEPLDTSDCASDHELVGASLVVVVAWTTIPLARRGRGADVDWGYFVLGGVDWT